MVLQDIINNDSIGSYRDDGLIALNKVNSQKTDTLRKKMIQVFKGNGFGIDIVTNLVEVNLFNVILNLRNGLYRPYKKPNGELKYINVFSNHLPHLLKQLTTTIKNKLSRNSFTELIVNESKYQYEDALRKSGFKDEFTYKDSPAPINRKLIKRKRKTIWFNPPYNQNVSANIVKIFLKLVGKHFPRTHRLHQISNRNTLKKSAIIVMLMYSN